MRLFVTAIYKVMIIFPYKSVSLSILKVSVFTRMEAQDELVFTITKQDIIIHIQAD